MAYKRKGGSGFTGSPRDAFNYYRRQYEKRLKDQFAFSFARNGQYASKPVNLFKNIDYNTVLTKGITRVNRETGEIVRYTGQEAIRVQTESFKRLASKSYVRDAFIVNYLNTMRRVGFSEYQIDFTKQGLEKISSDVLTVMIDNGDLPEIKYLYDDSERSNEWKLIEDALSKKNINVVKDEAQALRKKTKEIKDFANKLYEDF